ncbi:mannose-6-phosphate isomerase, class I [Naasia sp. SYSU D00057]|uniref:mannose-6-phosphate isomerase, class I n=1 Tax=Naasia sp. SYSU D00057 TaxID=2817380 RepID=UPI001B3099D1|nr:mannose-6-phosphate isomerase, class I [Naasia sp. SYSU D00057]
MFVGITNTPKDYAWGSPSAIAELLGRRPSGGPEAELWLGAHPLAPSRIVDPGTAGNFETLDAFIAADPARALGPDRTSDTLPFLLKVLAADQPLSIQAHPSPEQAREGFARENAAGVPLDAGHRMYKDEGAKPELVYALSDTFEALAGFRDLSFTRVLLLELRTYASVGGDQRDADLLQALADKLNGTPDAALRRVLEFAFEGGDEARATMDAVIRAAGRAPSSTSYAREYATLHELAELHPGDPGILVALLMNRVSLPQGQALYLPSGNIHAYLRGLAIEIMAASDNVLRGGLTGKHVDTAELQKVVRFEPVPAPLLRAEGGRTGVEVYRPDVPDFLLVRIAVGAAGAEHGYQLAGEPAEQVPLPGPGILLALGGTVTVNGRASGTQLRPGEAAFVTPDEGELEIAGDGIVFLATVNR